MAKPSKSLKSEKADKSEKQSNKEGMAKEGLFVSLDYEGRLESGEVFDSSKHGDHSHPLEFQVGSGQVIPGFDSAVKGMKVGEEKEFKIIPSEAYGEYNPQLTKEIPRNTLPKEQEPKVGMTLLVGTPQGQFPVTITKVSNENVTIDLNHPLAGKTLIFKIKVIGLSSQPSQHDHGHDHSH